MAGFSRAEDDKALRGEVELFRWMITRFGYDQSLHRGSIGIPCP